MSPADRAAAPAQGEIVVSEQGSLDAVDLFLFSAAVGLAHRIHYDDSFARGEGLPGLPVHGPLQAAYLSRIVGSWAREQDGRLVTISFRHSSPLIAGEAFTATARRVPADEQDAAREVVLEVVLEVDGRTCTEGRATVRLSRACCTDRSELR